MPSLEAMVQQRVALTAQRDAAMRTLAQRAGVALPEVPDAGRPRPLPAYMNGDLAVTVFLLEMVEMLATELDAMKSAKGATKR